MRFGVPRCSGSPGGLTRRQTGGLACTSFWLRRAWGFNRGAPGACHCQSVCALCTVQSAHCVCKAVPVALPVPGRRMEALCGGTFVSNQTFQPWKHIFGHSALRVPNRRRPLTGHRARAPRTRQRGDRGVHLTRGMPDRAPVEALHVLHHAGGPPRRSSSTAPLGRGSAIDTTTLGAANSPVLGALAVVSSALLRLPIFDLDHERALQEQKVHQHL